MQVFLCITYEVYKFIISLQVKSFLFIILAAWVTELKITIQNTHSTIL